MRPQLILFCALLACSRAQAALHDTGPMGGSASGAPTPDATVKSKARLPDLATPTPATSTAAVLAEITGTSKTAVPAVWQQMQDLSKRIGNLLSAGQIKPMEAEDAERKLSALRGRYGLRTASDALKLSPRQTRQLKLELNALERKFDLAAPPTE